MKLETWANDTCLGAWSGSADADDGHDDVGHNGVNHHSDEGGKLKAGSFEVRQAKYADEWID